MKKIRRHVTWSLTLSFFWLNACQAPLNTLVNGSSPQKSADKSGMRGFLPKSVYYSHGIDENHIEGFGPEQTENIKESIRRLKKLSNADQTFGVQAYPTTTGCQMCGVDSLNATMTWPKVVVPVDLRPENFLQPMPYYGQAPTGNTLTEGSPDFLTSPGYTGYSYGLGIQSYGTDTSGQQIATGITVGMALIASKAGDSPSFSNSLWASTQAVMTSVDGIHFQAQSSQSDSSGVTWGWGYRSNAVYLETGGCPPVVSGSTLAGMHLDAATLTLDPFQHRGKLHMVLSAPMTVNAGFAY